MIIEIQRYLTNRRRSYSSSTIFERSFPGKMSQIGCFCNDTKLDELPTIKPEYVCFDSKFLNNIVCLNKLLFGNYIIWFCMFAPETVSTYCQSLEMVYLMALCVARPVSDCRLIPVCDRRRPYTGPYLAFRAAWAIKYPHASKPLLLEVFRHYSQLLLAYWVFTLCA